VENTIQNFLWSLTVELDSWDVALPRAIITYNNTIHAELHLSPSSFLMTKVHQVSHKPPLQGDLALRWRVGHPRFSAFDVDEMVLYKIQHKGFLNINKLCPCFRGPFKIS
jgi:hypothetical protein